MCELYLRRCRCKTQKYLFSSWELSLQSCLRKTGMPAGSCVFSEWKCRLVGVTRDTSVSQALTNSAKIDRDVLMSNQGVIGVRMLRWPVLGTNCLLHHQKNRLTHLTKSIFLMIYWTTCELTPHFYKIGAGDIIINVFLILFWLLVFETKNLEYYLFKPRGILHIYYSKYIF